jgi:hypothetical protein
MYPVPATDFIGIKTSNEFEYSVLVRASNGQQVFYKSHITGNIDISCENWYSGTYSVEFSVGSKRVQTLIVVVSSSNFGK